MRVTIIKLLKVKFISILSPVTSFKSILKSSTKNAAKSLNINEQYNKKVNLMMKMSAKGKKSSRDFIVYFDVSEKTVLIFIIKMKFSRNVTFFIIKVNFL